MVSFVYRGLRYRAEMALQAMQDAREDEPSRSSSAILKEIERERMGELVRVNRVNTVSYRQIHR